MDWTSVISERSKGSLPRRAEVLIDQTLGRISSALFEQLDSDVFIYRTSERPEGKLLNLTFVSHNYPAKLYLPVELAEKLMGQHSLALLLVDTLSKLDSPELGSFSLVDMQEGSLPEQVTHSFNLIWKERSYYCALCLSDGLRRRFNWKARRHVDTSILKSIKLLGELTLPLRNMSLVDLSIQQYGTLLALPTEAQLRLENTTIPLKLAVGRNNIQLQMQEPMTLQEKP